MSIFMLHVKSLWNNPVYLTITVTTKHNISLKPVDQYLS